MQQVQYIVKHFWLSITAFILGLFFVFFYGAWAAVGLTLLLIMLEVTLSFDNAVVNARVLTRMNDVWQHRFLTWGILVAVFGTRLVLPILIVSVVVWMNPWAVTMLAFFDPAHYGELLEKAKYAIHAFGAAFLIMVSLKYFLDAKKELHWIKSIEARISRWGNVESIEIALALAVVALVSYFVPAEAQFTALLSGVIGVVLYLCMQGITNAFEGGAEDLAKGSAAMFVYLEVLDAAFSLDGVIGAFALTSEIPIIAVGLGVGAFFVRSLTVYMVHERTLDTLKYLEHGAHWAIFGLAVSMFVSLLTEVPEAVTGTIGIVFVAAAYWSSLKSQGKMM